MAIADPYVPAPPVRPRRHQRWYSRYNLTLILITFFFLFGLISLWPYIFVTIGSGHAGVYYSLLFGGTDTKWIRREGFHFKFPWDTIFDYDIRIQQLAYRYSVISADGLIIQFRTSVRCRPRFESLGLLQQTIGPDYVDKIVIPETQTALREVVGDTPLDQIYSTNVNILQKAVVRTVQEISGKYIEIDDILITDIGIPDEIKRAIEAKLAQQQNSLQYDYVLSVSRKEAERKRIEAEGIRDFQNIVTPGISLNFLRWKGIEATLDLSKSANTKVIVIGAQNGLPLILDTASGLSSTNSNQTTPSLNLNSVEPSPPGPLQEPPVPKISSNEVENPGLLVPVPVSTPGPNSALSPWPLEPTPLPTPVPPVTHEAPTPSPSAQSPVTRERAQPNSPTVN
jgi:regulator of protease activity HflC (stomatin/prohibitin superfamily)